MTARTANRVPAALLLAAGALLLGAAAPVPRASPELKFLNPADQEVLLSSYKGKVVLIEFLLTNCPHCSRVAQVINNLHRDMGPRGFQAFGIAFENGMTGPLVNSFASDFKVAFPVGYTSSNAVDSYLGRVGMEYIQVPQIVVIDRRGVIRAQSHAVGERDLENEVYLRHLIGTLLGDTSPSWISTILPVTMLAIIGAALGWRMNQKRQNNQQDR
jgi:peroxiredoxin